MMMTTNPRCLAAASALATSLCLFYAGCSESGGPAPVRTGTPAYYFQNAKDAYAKGDFVKAQDWLDKATKMNKNEFTGKAWAMRLLLTAGQIGGYADLAQHYEYGQRSAKANPTPFIKKVTEYRGLASRMALQFGESYAEYLKTEPGAETEIDFPFPSTGTTAKAPQLNKIAEGIVPNEGDVAVAQSASVARGVVMAICEAVGAPEDASKGRAAMQTLPLKVPRSAFELAMARGLNDAAHLYSTKLGSNPTIQEFLAKQALKALEKVTSTDKPVKELKTKIEAELKEAQKKKS